MTTLNHDVDPDRRADIVPAPIVIGRRVWLGGAGAVVTKDVPANATVAGIPAKLIRMTRFSARPN